MEEKKMENQMETGILQGITGIHNSHLVNMHGFIPRKIVRSIPNYQKDPCVHSW